MSTRLGIFDSGLGGFTVLRQVFARYGDVDCVYLADTARIPYGEKQPSEMRAIAKEVVNWLIAQDISVILIACNTTNSLALDVVETVSDVPVFGLIGAAAKMIKEKRVGVLATPATASSNAYRSEILSLSPGVLVIEQSCPAFVPLIETGHLCIEKFRSCAKEYLQPLIDARVEAVVFGCSHYPLLEPLIRDLLPRDIRLIDPAVGLVSQLDCFLGSTKQSDDMSTSLGKTRICVTSDPDSFAARVVSVMGNCPEIELISLTPNACFF